MWAALGGYGIVGGLHSFDVDIFVSGGPGRFRGAKRQGFARSEIEIFDIDREPFLAF